MDHYQRSLLNGFFSPLLSRVGHRRRDDGWIAERLESPEARFIPLWDLKPLFTEAPSPRPVVLSGNDLNGIREKARSIVFLGEVDHTPYFAIDLADNGVVLPQLWAHLGQFQDLKRMSGLIEPHEGGLLAYARAMAYWHQRHRFCGDCGSPTRITGGGHVRVCTNEQCGQQHFPRTDPAIIVLVSHGDWCLMGRQAVWPKRMYSALAGFVEPGESVESAVIREVWEETGIEVQEVHYHSSQPWPFPASLMLGFMGRAVKRTIRPTDEELEDARWFSREEIQIGLEQGTFSLPPAISIAYRLIEDWFDAESPIPLKAIASAEKVHQARYDKVFSS